MLHMQHGLTLGLRLVRHAFLSCIQDVTPLFPLCLQLKDPATGMDLCAYHLEDTVAAARRQYTCVIMCRLYRKPGAAGQWEVQALGRLCGGYAGQYGDVLACISQIRQGR